MSELQLERMTSYYTGTGDGTRNVKVGIQNSPTISSQKILAFRVFQLGQIAPNFFAQTPYRATCRVLDLW